MTFPRVCISDYTKSSNHSQRGVEEVSNEWVWSRSHGKVAAARIHQDVQLQKHNSRVFLTTITGICYKTTPP